MLSFFIGLMLGAGATIAALLWLLLKFDPTPAMQAALIQRRVEKRIAFATSMDTPPTPWELTQQQLSSSSTEFESCAWINSIAAYAFTFLSEKINAAAADGRLEAFINSRLARKRMPEFVCAPVVVLQLSVGRSLPVLHSIRVTQTDPERPLVETHEMSASARWSRPSEFTASIGYNGSAYIAAGTSVCVPHLPFVSLPVEIALKDLAIDVSAHFRVDLSHLPRVAVTMTLSPDLHLDFDLHTHFGSKLVLEDLHVLQTAFKLVVREIMQEELVAPNNVTFEVEAWKPHSAAAAATGEADTHKQGKSADNAGLQLRPNAAAAAASSSDASHM